MAGEKPALHFPASSRSLIEPYLPPAFSSAGLNAESNHDRSTPFVTLTFAQSLDAAISLTPGTQTTLSSPETKAMTHFLRSKHDAILVGVGTAVADDPSLNCRIEGATINDQPRPVIIDPDHRWIVTESNCWRLASQRLGRRPLVIVDHNIDGEFNHALHKMMEDNDSLYVVMPREVVSTPRGAVSEISWIRILKMLKGRGYGSVMIEGGATVITSLLRPENLHLVDSVIVTIAPTWLGQGSVTVSPGRRQDHGETLRLRDTKWHQFGEDVVMCGRVHRDSIPN